MLTRFLGVLVPSRAKAFCGETALTAKTLAGDYETWCDRFLLERLRLGLWLAILFNFTLLVAIQFTAVEPAIKKLVPSIPSLIAAIEISLLGENAGEGIYQSTSEGSHLTANPALASILGYESPEEVIANLTDIGHQIYVDPNRKTEFVRLMEQHGTVSEFESQVYR